MILNISQHTLDILLDIVNSSECYSDGRIVSDKLRFTPLEVNEVLWELYDKIKEVNDGNQSKISEG